MAKAQWGAPGRLEGDNAGWGTRRIGAQERQVAPGRITTEEVEAAVRKVAKGKAPGLDDIPAEV